MNGDDLKRMQDRFLDIAKQSLHERGHLRTVGFVITRHRHVEQLYASGWAAEFLDPKDTFREPSDNNIATLVVDLVMDWKRLYHAILNVFPKTRDILPPILAQGQALRIDDPYMRTTRPFMAAANLDEKDVIAATMRQICDKVEAFACIFQSEAWLRAQEPSEREEEILKKIGDLGSDEKSVEVVISSMETRELTRMCSLPIERKPSWKGRDAGKITGFGTVTEHTVLTSDREAIGGRFAQFLKPLSENPETVS